MSYTDSVISSNGADLVVRHWPAPDGVKTKAKIVYVHGFSEHNDLYSAWWPRIVSHGYDVTMFDQRGFGKTASSVKDFGITSDENQFKDLDRVISTVLDGSDVPMILWGHSMGGGITLNYMVRGTMREKFSAYMANSPYVLGNPQGPNGQFLVKLIPLAMLVVPGMRQQVEIDPRICTNDPAKVEQYKRDPLRHNIGTVRLFSDMKKRGKALVDPDYVKRSIDRPVLVSQGDNDLLCDVKGAQEYFRLLNNSDKTLEIYPGMPHELQQLKEPEVTDHLNKVLAWLDARFDKADQSIKPDSSTAKPASKLDKVGA
ncbi:Putative monoglyceride lipase [Wickerhamiella sorbophila]|uniref:Monoglyceride lipase n=1 Tax=Wickerhamiella sorbophila TaxID=45607 RepID=A0A2T0FLV3_9ASCO|nr:Putative monoglyceride lipase [Wickerhamiella sorbophila]PRT55971.1 Putative monoglyceride lipase [Wickerhamiella sorbophila]